MYEARRRPCASGTVRGGVFFLSASLASSTRRIQTSFAQSPLGRAGYPTFTNLLRPAGAESDRNLLFTLAPRSNGHRTNGSVQSYGISGRLAPAGRCAAQYAISDSLRKCLDESHSVPPHKSFQAGRHVATRPKATTTKTVHTPIFQAQTNMLPTKVLPIMAQKRVRCCSRSGKCHWTH